MNKGEDFALLTGISLDWGSACWDVGSVFADYLSLWCSSLPLLDETGPENIKTKYRLERITACNESILADLP